MKHQINHVLTVYFKIIFHRLFIILLAGSFTFYSYGQQNYRISKPRLSIFGSNLNISYDIQSMKPNEEFYVWVNLTDSNDIKINNNSLHGDVGKNIKAGRNKSIIWTPSDYRELYYRGNISATIHAIKQKQLNQFNFIPTNLNKVKSNYTLLTFTTLFCTIENIIIAQSMYKLRDDIDRLGEDYIEKEQIRDRHSGLLKTYNILTYCNIIPLIMIFGTHMAVDNNVFFIGDPSNVEVLFLGLDLLGFGVMVVGNSFFARNKGSVENLYSDWNNEYYDKNLKNGKNLMATSAVLFGITTIGRICRTALLSTTFKNYDVKSLSIYSSLDPVSGSSMLGFSYKF